MIVVSALEHLAQVGQLQYQRHHSVVLLRVRLMLQIWWQSVFAENVRQLQEVEEQLVIVVVGLVLVSQEVALEFVVWMVRAKPMVHHVHKSIFNVRNVHTFLYLVKVPLLKEIKYSASRYL